LVVGLFASSALGGGAVVWWAGGMGEPAVAAMPGPAQLRQGLLQDEINTIRVFEATSPSVVFIQNKMTRRGAFSMDETEIPRGSGSGFVWDDKGHIVTNYHVIHGADALRVTLGNGNDYDAVVVGAEPSKDLAVLRIKAGNDELVPVKLADSSALVVGQKVLAIGNPFGLDHSLSTGVVSALGREIKSLTGRTILDVIQTDAAINPGNSGGPLLDSAGALLGVNTSIFSTSGSSAGIGFAVPSNTVARIVPQLIRHGRVIRPGLGVVVLNERVAKRFGVDGVVVSEVVTGGPAQVAGMTGIQSTSRRRVELGDVIVTIDGKAVKSFDELSNVLEQYDVGDTVTVGALRQGRSQNFKIKLAALGE
jgi:S1-C subfamily serine protease